MKKSLLFIGSLLMAMGAFAQSYTPSDKGDITGGSTITSVPGIVLTFGGEKDAELNLDGIESKDFASNTLEYNGVTYNGYFNGANNPKIDNSTTPSAEAGMPNTGTYFKFTVSKTGNLDVAYVLNATKPFFVYEISATGTIAALDGFNGMTTAEKVYQGSTFPVKAGCTYYVFCTGSKLGFYGFNFVEGQGSSISEATDDAAVVKTDYYSVTGAKLSQPTKGLTIVRETLSNGKVVCSKMAK